MVCHSVRWKPGSPVFDSVYCWVLSIRKLENTVLGKFCLWCRFQESREQWRLDKNCFTLRALDLICCLYLHISIPPQTHTSFQNKNLNRNLPSTPYAGLQPLKIHPHPEIPKYATGTKMWLLEYIITTSCLFSPNSASPLPTLRTHWSRSFGESAFEVSSASIHIGFSEGACEAGNK